MIGTGYIFGKLDGSTFVEIENLGFGITGVAVLPNDAVLVSTNGEQFFCSGSCLGNEL